MNAETKPNVTCPRCGRSVEWGKMNDASHFSRECVTKVYGSLGAAYRIGARR